MADQSRTRCGNDPRARLTDGDRKALAEFRTFLTERSLRGTDAARTAVRQARGNEAAPQTPILFADGDEQP